MGLTYEYIEMMTNQDGDVVDDLVVDDDNNDLYKYFQNFRNFTYTFQRRLGLSYVIMEMYCYKNNKDNDKKDTSTKL